MIAVVASRLMNAAAWNEIPLVVSCTLVPRERMSTIVKAHVKMLGAHGKEMSKKKRSCQRERPSLNILLLS